MIGTQILNYRIVSLIGDGGMGTVYLAEHIKLNRKVAIKMLHPHLAANESIRMRFENEAKTMSDLIHPNIVRLSDYHEDSTGLYLIMEYIDGGPLDAYIRNVSGPIPEEKAIHLFRQALDAFQYAHDRGIVHRDIKPSNLILANDGQLKVLDFGIAKLLGNQSHSLTKTGSLTGTVYYMSPEQVRGKELDHRSDIYSLGITLYQMVTGINPYHDLTTEYEIYDKIVNTPLPDPRTVYPAVSEHISRIIQKATEKDPANRYQSCREFSMAFESAEAINFQDDSKEKTLVDQQVPFVSATGTTGVGLVEEKTMVDQQPFQPLPPKKSNKLFLAIPVVLLFLAGAGFAAYHFFIKGNKKEAVVSSSQPQTIDSPVVVASVVDTPVVTTVTTEAPKKTPVDSPLVKKKQVEKKEPVVNREPEVEQTSMQTTQTSATVKLVVRGSSVIDFASKIRTESERLMKGKGYKPQNVKCNMSRYEFSCDLVPMYTSFVRIGLFYAPIEEGWCEPCSNALKRYPGSEVIIEKTDNSFQYNFIAISQ